MPTAEALFLDAGPGRAGQRHVVWHRPLAEVPRGNVVFLHPFGEEMNKSRRMASLGARALARTGMAVLQIDHLGCGDSSGDFADASWDAWVDDALLAARWLQAHHDAPLWFWGLRAGALLACEAARRHDGPVSLLFWQPVASGKAHLQAFLRLGAMAGLGEGDKATGVVAQLRAQLASGEPVDIAGYRLSPDLATGLEAATLQPVPGIERLLWLETSTRPEPELLPASRAVLQQWEALGAAAEARAVTGPSFWQTQEIETAAALVDATADLLAAPLVEST